MSAITINLPYDLEKQFRRLTLEKYEDKQGFANLYKMDESAV